MQFKQATRQGIKPLIGIYSGSGKGKTMSALLLARGFAGPKGKIAMIDTESGRGSLYADVIPGGYEVLELRQPFSPARYVEAIRAAEELKPAVLIIDSISHEWENSGGVTDMATEISQKRAEKYNKEWDGVVQFGDWKQPKMEHAKFMLALLQSPLPIICCLRAKQKSQQVKGTKEMADAGIIDARQIGKTCVVKDSEESPIQDEHFVYEMTVNLNINFDHSVNVVKSSHPELRKCFPEDRKAPISIEHGELLAKWCSNPIGPTSAGATVPKDELKSLAQQLWDLLKPVRGPEKDWKEANNYMWREDLLDAAAEEEAPKLSIERMKKLIEDVKRKADKTGL